MVRKEKCPGCQQSVEKQFSNCPQCGLQLRRCAKCKKLLKPFANECDKCGRVGVITGGLYGKNSRDSIWKRNDNGKKKKRTAGSPSPAKTAAPLPNAPAAPESVKVGGPTETNVGGSRVDNDRIAQMKKQMRRTEIRAVDDVQNIRRNYDDENDRISIDASDSVVKANITQNTFYQQQSSYKWILERPLPNQGVFDVFLIYCSENQSRYVGKFLPVGADDRYDVEKQIRVIPTPGIEFVDYDRVILSSEIYTDSSQMQRGHEQSPCLVLLRKYIDKCPLHDVEAPVDWEEGAKLIRGVAQCLAERGSECCGISPGNLFVDLGESTDFWLTDFRFLSVKRRIGDLHAQFASDWREYRQEEDDYYNVGSTLSESCRDVAALGLILCHMLTGWHTLVEDLKAGNLFADTEQAGSLLQVANKAVSGDIQDLEQFSNQVGSVLRTTGVTEDPFLQNLLGGSGGDQSPILL